MMTGIGVHHRSESVFTFDRNDRSRWAGIRTNAISIVPDHEKNGFCSRQAVRGEHPERLNENGVV